MKKFLFVLVLGFSQFAAADLSGVWRGWGTIGPVGVGDTTCTTAEVRLQRVNQKYSGSINVICPGYPVVANFKDVATKKEDDISFYFNLVDGGIADVHMYPLMGGLNVMISVSGLNPIYIQLTLKRENQ